MARILVTAEPEGQPQVVTMLNERIVASDLASAHFANHLIERIGWALLDADAVTASPGGLR